MSDSSIQRGSTPAPSGDLAVADGTSIGGDGSVQRKFHTIAGGTPIVTDGVTVFGDGTNAHPVSLGSGGGAAPMFLPSTWIADQLAAGQSYAMPINVVLSAGTPPVGTVMQREGSIVGLSCFLDKALTAGQVALEITINGDGKTLTLVITPSSAQAAGIVQASSIDTYNITDIVGVTVTASDDMEPVSNINVLAFVQAIEAAS